MLADYTKFSRKSLYKICKWQAITALMTNDMADPLLVAKLEKQTQVILGE